MKNTLKTLYFLIQPAPRFQRAINLKYDISASDTIASFIPTPNAADAIKEMLWTTEEGAVQRAFVLVGAYGAGKSLLGVVLAALLSADASLCNALEVVIGRLKQDFPEVGELAEEYLQEGKKLLPVILSGDEGDLNSALGRALNRALQRVGLNDVKPATFYKAALDTISLWEKEYPEVFNRFETALKERDGVDVSKFKSALESHQPATYDKFVALYPRLAAGASFDAYHGQSIIDAYAKTAEEIRPLGYSGIIVLYDEFGRYLESKAGEPFGQEAKLLQDFAEHCNRSGENQLHLVIITHQSLMQYAYGLPEAFQQEWGKIEGRFRCLPVSSSQEVSLKLIAEALQFPEKSKWESFKAKHQAQFDELFLRAVDAKLFEHLSDAEIRTNVIEGAYPLHPVTTYCLPRLSEKVAQNERTLFTFLASDEPHALGEFLSNTSTETDELPLVYLDRLYDYFEIPIKTNTIPGGTHGVWSDVQNALKKVSPDETSVERNDVSPIIVRLIKSLGVIHAVNSPSSAGASASLRPTTEILAYALDADRTAVDVALEYLKKRKILIHRKTDSYWTFLFGSDVDFEQLIAENARNRPISSIKQRLLLEQVLPPKHYLARRYNDRYGMIRFFWSLYRTVDDLGGIDDWEILLKERDYADGFLIFVLAMNAPELTQAERIAMSTKHPRVVFVLPKSPITISEQLNELATLNELKNVPEFREGEDAQRIQQELEFFIEDAVERLERSLAPLVEPRRAARWFYEGREINAINSPGRVSRLLSELCERQFSRTPRIYNESFNKRQPSSQQVRAAEKVIDAFLTEPLEPNLGLKGFGPDVAIVNTVLKSTGMLKDVERNGVSLCEISKPEASEHPEMAEIWETAEQFFKGAIENEIDFAPLVDRLQSPPYGLRKGVLPIIIAAAFRQYLPVATIKHGQEIVSPIRGTTFTEICAHPERYTLRMEAWGERQHAMVEVLEELFSDRTLPEEKRYQPLRYLSLGMLRWLQSLPKYARETEHLSNDALQLRNIVRQAQVDSASALFTELPKLLLDSNPKEAIPENLRETIAQRLRGLMDEINSSYLNLHRRLEGFVVEQFATGEERNYTKGGHEAIVQWVKNIQQSTNLEVQAQLFDDEIKKALIVGALSAKAATDNFLDNLVERIVGLPTRDWTDETETQFRQRLTEVKSRIEEELYNRSSNPQELVEISLRLPNNEEKTYQFHHAEMSEHAKLLMENLKRTVEIAGRALSADEKRRIGVELLRYVLEH